MMGIIISVDPLFRETAHQEIVILSMVMKRQAERIQNHCSFTSDLYQGSQLASGGCCVLYSSRSHEELLLSGSIIIVV
jgi:hypothetical protein